MNITELRYLVAIKKWGSVSAAAKQLYAAQPNVSKALKNLEGEYGLRIFERSSTGMIPTEQGRRFIEQAARVLEEVDRLTEDAHHARERCAELRVMIPHATYASYAAVDFLKEAAGADQLRIHIREGGSMEALDFVLRRGYHLALLRYAAEDDDHYIHYCARRGLKMEPVMEFEYQLLTNRDGPLAKHEVKDLSELNHYMEIMHDDFQLPGEDGGDGVRWHVNDSRRIHVYERCSQFSILQQLPSAYMWASPMPQRALDQFHLVLKKCPAQRQVMRDVLVYPDHGALRSEEQAFIDLLHREAHSNLTNYVTLTRIQFAANLLWYHHYTITQAAQDVGIPVVPYPPVQAHHRRDAVPLRPVESHRGLRDEPAKKKNFAAALIWPPCNPL